ncbi:MAG: Tol biopolymer transporter periplasmic protein [Spirulina sp. DLM2.Bin59]|nr:MAG: Tol biopolymer transporter periplasmic protein [Spirulina sp. DLM2.Bin59]
MFRNIPWFAGLLIILAGCQSYPQRLNLSYDPGGRGVNSPAAELSPQYVGNYLVFVSDRNGSPDLYLFDTLSQRFLDLPGLNSLATTIADPSISEDGRYIAYLGSRLGLADVYVYDRETALSRNLTEGLQAQVRHPVISADGGAIAFEANQTGQWDILIYDRDGNALD